MQAAQVAAYWEANAEAWTRQTRAGCDIYRDKLNMPAFLSMLPPVAGLGGLDLGCGEGSSTRLFAALGAHIQAIDIARALLRQAQNAEDASPAGIVYQIADATALPFPDAAFDFVTAFMSLMDMPDPAGALKEAQRVLRPGGFLQFSILHPCFAPPHRRVVRDSEGVTQAIEVGRYFDTAAPRVETWQFQTLSPEEKKRSEPFRIPVFHRTLSEWATMLGAAGLVIEQMQEPSADAALARSEPILADTRVAPLFLHVRARKPAAANF